MLAQNAISRPDMQWIAGFLEGEGYFGTVGKTKRTPRVVAAQVQAWPIEHLHMLVGHGFVSVRKRQHKNWEPVTYWEVTGFYAADLMLTLKPFMSPRRQEQIEAALHDWLTAPARMPPGMGIKNPSSPFYQGSNARRKFDTNYDFWKYQQEKRDA